MGKNVKYEKNAFKIWILLYIMFNLFYIFSYFFTDIAHIKTHHCINVIYVVQCPKYKKNFIFTKFHLATENGPPHDTEPIALQNIFICNHSVKFGQVIDVNKYPYPLDFRIFSHIFPKKFSFTWLLEARHQNLA